jgi:glycosyltransferase involved in cell wall biosynthesis
VPDMLSRITPVILTYNEEANIGRVLARLAWAKDIVVVDSSSTDATREIATGHPGVRFVGRVFDEHARQWNFALKETGIATEWVLALDADYLLTDAGIAELAALEPPPEVDGYRSRFVYCVDGKPLRATLYPPVTILFRRERASYVQDGHTQRVLLEGQIERLRHPVRHDDRKSLTRWIAAQDRYARIEAAKYLDPGFKATRLTEKVRALRVVAPVAMLAYCLFVKLLVLDGKAGIFFSFQRALAELLLSLNLIRHDLDRQHDPRGDR